MHTQLPPLQPNVQVAPGSQVMVQRPPLQPKKQVAPALQVRVQPPALQKDSQRLPDSHVVWQVEPEPHAWTQHWPVVQVQSVPLHSLF